jgi:hypothetical protein
MDAVCPLSPPERPMTARPIPPGYRLATGYLSLRTDVDLVQMDGMDWLTVERYRAEYRALPNGAQLVPCPHGVWRDSRWRLEDGRHRLVALAMLGYGQVLVSWLERVE